MLEDIACHATDGLLSNAGKDSISKLLKESRPYTRDSVYDEQTIGVSQTWLKGQYEGGGTNKQVP